MSEQSKNNIIKAVYYDKSGYGSVQTTYKQARRKDDKITIKDVRNWFYINIENEAKAKGYNSYINNAPYEEYQMDLIFFGADEESQNVAVSMIDIFSKWAVVIPVKSKHKEILTSAILEAMTQINPNKRPRMMYCDSDAYFIKPWFSELMETEGVHLYLTKQSPMVVERFNRTFKKMIWTRLKASTGKSWKDFVDEVLVVYNYQMVSSVTNMTPAEARKPANTLQTKVDLEMRRHSARKYPTIEVGDYVRTFYRKQTQQKKEHLTNWSEDKYKVTSISESFGQKYYHVEGESRVFLRHDLKKVPPPSEE